VTSILAKQADRFPRHRCTVQRVPLVGSARAVIGVKQTTGAPEVSIGGAINQTSRMPDNHSNWSRRLPRPGYLGGLLPDQPVLVREPNLVAYISGIRVYPEGFGLGWYVEQATADGPLSSEPPEGRPSEPSLSGQAQAWRLPLNDPRVSIRFSTGRLWTDTAEATSDRLLGLGVDASLGETGASWHGEYWLADLPSAGPLVFAIRLGVVSGFATLDGDYVREAATRAVDLWDDSTPS
jgi:hypothetical protein